MAMQRVFYNLLMWLLTFVCSVNSAPIESLEIPDGYWFGTQDLNCVAVKDIMKRSAPERSTMLYVHRLLYYKGIVYEWGVGTQGYHIGPNSSVTECPVTWETEPAGTGTCHPMVLESFTEGYRARYGVYNLVTNNCHHYANRLSALLSSNMCGVGEDRWKQFSDNFWKFIKRFTDVFDENDSPNSGTREETKDGEWPIVHWYKK